MEGIYVCTIEVKKLLNYLQFPWDMSFYDHQPQDWMESALLSFEASSLM